jgi:hypothetical protein
VGTSDAIIFETGSQTQAMRILTGGEVEIGPQTSGYAGALLDISYNTGTLATPQAGYQQVRLTGANSSSPAFVMESFGAVGVYPNLVSRVASGTLQAPTAVAGNQTINSFLSYAYNGSNYGLCAQIAISTINQQSATDSSGALAFNTVVAGTTTLTQAMQVRSGVSVGTGTDPGVGQLLVNTAIISPLHIGGQNATSTLTIESTNAAGTGDAIIFQTGSQKQAGRITTAQEWLVGPQTAGYTAALLDVQYNTGTPATPQSGYQQLRISGGNGTSISFSADTFGSAVYANLLTRAASGTLQTPAAVAGAQTINSILAYAYNGSNYGLCAQIAINTVNQQSATDSSGALAFNTVVPGTTTLTQAMQLRAGLSVGTGTDPGTGGILLTGTATVGGALSVGGAGTVSGELSVGGFLNATALAVGTTTNPGTNALQVIGTATIGGLLSVAGAANITGTATITNYANASSLALGTTTNPGAGGFIITGTATVGGPLSASSLVAGTTTDLGAGLIQATRSITAMQGVALVSGGTASGYDFFSVANFGIFAGTGVPTIAAGTGSLYLRNDGSTATTRIYVNQNGSTTWTAMTTQA